MKNFPRSFKRNAGVSAAMLGVSALLLSGCGAAPEEENEGSSEAAASSDFTGCIVSDAGGWDDRSFNQSTYEGLMAAKDKLGIETREVESKDASDYTNNVNSTVDAGCDLTVTVGFLLSDATKDAAEANPDTNFAIVDDNAIELDNVKPIIYDTAQAAFLAGYVAAGSTETGTVATYGGMNIPTVTIFMEGFADGIKYYNEENGTDVKLLGADSFVDSFDNRAAGKTLTQNFINEGADIIMPVAGPVGLGTMEAVVEANDSGKDVKAVWVDSDGYLTAGIGQEYILTSVMKLMGEAVEEVVTETADDNFSSEPYVGTLENGGVDLAPFHDQEGNVPEEVKSAIEDLKAKIISGEIKVNSKSSPQQ